MSKKRVVSSITFITALAVMFLAINKISDANKAAAYIVKEPSSATASNSLKPVTYNGENMYVAKATFYDYHSDAEIGTSSTPNAITGALDSSKNTFEQFNTKLFNLMQYGDATNSPANYPMYQGRFVASGLMNNIYKPGDEAANTATNFWVAANSPQGIASATQGLVDKSLKTTASGETVLTQTNTKTGKTAAVPYFSKSFLTTNKFDNSELSLGTVRENVSFPFRKEVKNNTTYYKFYSNEDTIKFNSNNEIEYLGHKNSSVQVKDPHNDAGFFPYNTAADSGSERLNYGHGLKIEIPFIITNDGKINGKDLIFEFSGDDDVWVFIDNQLALDIGGSHGEISGTINFAEKFSTVSKVKDPTLAFAKHSATSISAAHLFNNYKTYFSQELRDALKDSTKIHTLTFFYMERGMDVANLKINFNLPEPTKLTVSNKVDTSKINDALKSETEKVSAKDTFVYDIVDKTSNRKATMPIKNKESVLFANEFNQNDTLIVQESKLQNEQRSLTHYYSTSWTLSDAKDTIAKADKSLVIDDDRTSEDKTFKLANKSDNTVPVLTAAYVNVPKVGSVSIEPAVTDKYKEKYTDYETHNFKYTVSHKNIFNGDSAETLYNGYYTITNSDGTSSTKKATDGIITVKAGQTAKITGIPVDTVLSVKCTLSNDAKLSKVAVTNNFTLSNDKLTATGKVNSTTNIIRDTFTSEATTTTEEKIETPAETEKPDSELHNVSALKPSTKDEKKEVANDADALDGTPSTADNANVILWFCILGLSAIACITSAVILAKRETNYL